MKLSINGQGHSLTLVKGHSDFKVKCLTFGLYTQVSDSGPLGPLVYTSQSRARIRKLPVHDHMTHVVRIGILTGHEEIGNLHSEDYFSLHIYRKTIQFLNTYTIYFESIAYCLTKVCKNIYF